MASKKAATAILFTYEESGAPVFLTVARANSHKWNGEIMLGPAETQDSRDNGNIQSTLLRGLREEIDLDPKEVQRIIPLGDVGPHVRESFDYLAHFYLVEIPFDVMWRVVKKINSGTQQELSRARLTYRLQIGKKEKWQPHTEEIVRRLIQIRRRGAHSKEREGKFPYTAVRRTARRSLRIPSKKTG